MAKQRIAAIVLIVILLLAAVFGLSWYSNGFESFSSLYVTNEGEVVKGPITFKEDYTVANFEVKKAGFTFDTYENFTVEVIPNESNDFEYITGDTTYKLSDEENYTRFFKIESNGNKFTLSNEGKALTDILAELHGCATSDISILELSEETSYLTIVITTENDKTQSINIILPLGEYTSIITGIELNPNHIIFSANGVISENVETND
jgi:hypothetical protein